MRCQTSRAAVCISVHGNTHQPWAVCRVFLPPITWHVLIAARAPRGRLRIAPFESETWIQREGHSGLFVFFFSCLSVGLKNELIKLAKRPVRRLESNLCSDIQTCQKVEIYLLRNSQFADGVYPWHLCLHLSPRKLTINATVSQWTMSHPAGCDSQWDLNFNRLSNKC